MTGLGNPRFSSAFSFYFRFRESALKQAVQDRYDDGTSGRTDRDRPAAEHAEEISHCEYVGIRTITRARTNVVIQPVRIVFISYILYNYLYYYIILYSISEIFSD